MSDSELISILTEAKNKAAIYTGEFMQENNKFLSGYLGLKSGDFAGIPDQSSVVSTDIQDVVESDMPSLVRVFLGSGDVVKFTPSGSNPAEEREAEEKTKYVNWIVRNQPESFKIIHDWLKDAEIQKNGVVKYFIDERKEVETVEYEGVNQQELDEIVESLKDATVDRVKVEVEEQAENEEEQTFDIKFRVTKETQKVCIINIPPESFLITRNATSLDDASLVGDTVRKTRGELLAEGFKRELIDQLPSVDIDDNQDSEIQTIRNKDQGGFNRDTDLSEWASEHVEIYDLYIKIDYDGDGIAERRHIMLSGNKVLVNECFNHVPYASLSAILMPHKAIGRSRAEITYETQRQKTSLLRAMNDNIHAVNQPRNVVHGDVDLDDMLTMRVNGIVRMEDDSDVLPQNAVFPLTVPYMGDKTLQVIQYVDQARAQRTGSLLANQGLDADTIAKETATRFNGIQEEGQAKIELIARNYAETGFRKLYEGIAWLVSRYQNSASEIRVLGKQLTVNPKAWKYNQHIETTVGLGAGNNEALIGSLQGIYQIQSQLKAQGSMLVDEVDIYNTLKRITDGLGLPRVDEFFNNPEEPDQLLKAQNEALNTMVLQLQQTTQAQQQQIQQLQALSEVEVIKAKAKAEADNKAAMIKIAALEEDKRQFNIKTAQDSKQHDDEIAMDLTEAELKYNKNINGVN